MQGRTEDLWRYKATSEKKLHRTNQSCNFLEAVLAIEICKNPNPIQQPHWFFLKKRLIHFQINSTSAIVFPALKSTSYFLPAPIHSVSQVRSYLQLLPQIRCLILEWRLVSSAQIALLQITSSGMPFVYMLFNKNAKPFAYPVKR